MSIRLHRHAAFAALIATALATNAFADDRSEWRQLFNGHDLDGWTHVGPGSFVIETIFQIPGLGREFVNSAFNRDYTLILGTVILYASLIVLCNLVVDVVQVWLNPKLKFE